MVQVLVSHRESEAEEEVKIPILFNNMEGFSSDEPEESSRKQMS